MPLTEAIVGEIKPGAYVRWMPGTDVRMVVEGYDSTTDKYRCGWVVKGKPQVGEFPATELRELSVEEAHPEWYK